MKVLLVGHTYVPRINHAKLQSLASAGIRLRVLVPSNWRARRGLFLGTRFAVEEIEGPDFELFALPVWRPGHIASHLYPLTAAFRAIKTFAPDIVHIENEAYSFIAAQFVAAARLLGVKTTLFVWENVDWRVHATQYCCRYVALRYTTGVVCGNSGAKRLIAKWGYSGPTTVIPQLGVDPNLFAPPSTFDCDKVLTIGFVGRLVPEKGCDILLRAARLLVDRGIGVRCILCGTGPAKAALVQLVDDLELGAVVSFRNEVPYDRVPEVLREVSVLVLPSRSSRKWAEQFGHVLIEAMCAGCIVVGSRSGAIPEVIGRPDLVFEEGSADDLARILTSLAQDRSGRHSLRTFFRERVANYYTHEVVACRLVDFWKSLSTAPNSFQ